MSDQKYVQRKLTVAMFTNNFLPFVGGVPISITRFANQLRNRGHRIIIFAPEYSGTDPHEENIHRSKLLCCLRTSNFEFHIANIFSSEIDREFRKNRFDIIHVHHPFWMGKKGLQLANQYHLPIILTYHTRYELYSENLPFFKYFFRNYLSHRIVRNFSQQCDAIISPTASAENYLNHLGVDKPKMIMPTGIDISNYQVINQGFIESIRSKYLENGEKLLCSVARLSVEKNIEFLIRGLALAKANTPVRFKCILIGKGPEKDNLIHLIEELGLSSEIILVGSVNQEDLPSYYLASDFFVFSSLSETQGMVLLEAMAGKCPVVCLRSSGTDDMINDGFNGFKTSENLEEWSGKVITLLENTNTLETMSENALSYSHDFSMEKMAEKLETFYINVIADYNRAKGE